jgi:hypothetical protein
VRVVRPHSFPNMAELIPDNVSEQDVKDEANLRASKCGYCTRQGDPTRRQKIIVGWSRDYEENYERIFHG